MPPVPRRRSKGEAGYFLMSEIPRFLRESSLPAIGQRFTDSILWMLVAAYQSDECI
jgi:hypothetical protein